MAQRSLNKVQLIGNLTRDPELRYTPKGTAVCSLGLATNRTWVTDIGEKREETEFHRLVAWNKLAELCAQLLFKGRKIFVEGRLQTRQWTAQDGTPRQTTEIVISDMIILDSKRAPSGETGEAIAGEATALKKKPLTEASPAEEGGGAISPAPDDKAQAAVSQPAPSGKPAKKEKEEEEKKKKNEVKAEDIPF